MPGTLTDAHLPDGEFVRLLDGELDATERERAEGHIDRCSACRERLRTLQGRSTRLTSLLQESDWDTPTVSPAFPAELERTPAAVPRTGNRLTGAPWLRAAAVVAVLLGIAAVATPLPATLADWVAERWAELTSTGASEPASPGEPASTQEAGGTRVQFALEGDEMFLEFATRQAGGALTLRSADVELVSAEVVREGGAGADLLVLPAGLRVRNTAGVTADYTMVVPRGIRTVRVRVGEEAVIVLTGTELGEGRRVDISRERP